MTELQKPIKENARTLEYGVFEGVNGVMIAAFRHIGDAEAMVQAMGSEGHVTIARLTHESVFHQIKRDYQGDAAVCYLTVLYVPEEGK